MPKLELSQQLMIRGVSLRQLQVFLAVYQHHSITEAAKRLHLTQPTVSIQLKKLSEQLRTPLYQVHHKKMVFTESAAILANYAGEMLRNAELLEMELANLRELKSGTLKIAVVTTAQYFIPHIVGPFLQQHPFVDMQLTVVNRQQILERLNRGLDDIYVVSHLPESPPIHSQEFLENPLYLVAEAHHPLMAHPNLKLKDIANEPFILREPGSGTRLALEKTLKELGVQLNIRMVIESNEAIRECVAAGLGVSILSEHALKLGSDDRLKILPVNELPIVTHWHFVWPQHRNTSIVARAFIDYLGNDYLAPHSQISASSP
ncbi:LysR family transcriptional regulator [Ferrimonas sp. YFM]|uniref:LysR family transcriptional regulator n=1 Tax=Ferrimonas sp. YFM TaxID=3028878 RepID=UPI002573978B|nr:LysR family transcriptional regulator [Ferrimonas sp. YFM]BDY04896.1 transcriptional regulator [Ferrimonas sp. YFM]